MKIALLVAAVSMNAPWTLFLKVISTKLTLMYALTAVLVQTFARLKQFIQNKKCLTGYSGSE